MHFARWQKKDHHEVNWHPDFIGVGDESIVLRDLRAGATYALSAAVKAELDAATEPVKAALGPKLLDPYQGEATQRSW